MKTEASIAVVPLISFYPITTGEARGNAIRLQQGSSAAGERRDSGWADGVEELGDNHSCQAGP